MAELQLPSGHVALVDDDDLVAVVMAGPWRLRRESRRLYVRRNLSYTREQMLHQFLTGWPMTDHINGDGLDNRRSNLRPCNDKQNQANSIPVHAASGFRGVLQRESGRWQATIKRDGRLIYLGMFDTPEDAARAYDAAAVEAWGEYARPNFPLESIDPDPRPVRIGSDAPEMSGASRIPDEQHSARPGVGQPHITSAASPCRCLMCTTFNVPQRTHGRPSW